MMGSNGYQGYSGGGTAYGGFQGIGGGGGNPGSTYNNYSGGGGQNYGGGGGGNQGNAGGFISQSPFGGGSQGDSPSTVKRSGTGQQNLRPVTVKQLLDAKQLLPDAPFKVDGQDITQVSIVGRIQNIQQLATNITYMIDDGTGVIEARKWLEENDNSDYEGQRRDQQFTEGTYVRICGHFRSFKDKRNIMAFSVRRIESVDEITYHNLECIFVHMHLTRGPLPQHSSNTAQSNTQFTNQQQNNPYAPQEGVTTYAQDDGNMSRVHSEVLRVIRQHGNSTEGITVHAVADRCRGFADINGVRSAINDLCGEGLLYSTTDEDHFRATSD
ncbi:replication factor A protein 2 [Rhizophlyctis rosea]|nr:replication factor A protein 2 [Rhizophlyctis rosea]